MLEELSGLAPRGSMTTSMGQRTPTNSTRQPIQSSSAVRQDLLVVVADVDHNPETRSADGGMGSYSAAQNARTSAKAG